MTDTDLTRLKALLDEAQRAKAAYVDGPEVDPTRWHAAAKACGEEAYRMLPALLARIERGEGEPSAISLLERARDELVECAQDYHHQPKAMIAEAVATGQALGKKALYFGCWDRAGHYLYDDGGFSVRRERDFPSFPWDEALMDTGLLKNGKRADVCDGRVFWTCGGARAFWYAFYWWDRSIDERHGSNSGFYVRGFGWPETQAAFDYACAQFPRVVARQKFRLILVEPKGPRHE